MDAAKPPGIKIENILLAESEFKRVPDVPTDMPTHVAITVGIGFSDDKERLLVEMTATLNEPAAPVYARVKYVGIFVYDGDRNMTLEEYAKVNAPATLLPYVRNEIHELTRKAGSAQVFIPPINLVAAGG